MRKHARHNSPMVMAVQSRLDEGAGNRITFDIAVCGLLRFGKTLPLYQYITSFMTIRAPVLLSDISSMFLMAAHTIIHPII
jgi:hypothetical protein